MPLYFVMSSGRNLASPTLTPHEVDRKCEPIRMPPTSGAWRTLAFDEILDAVVIADDDRRLIDANSAACALFGVPLSGLLGRRVEEFTAASPDYDPIAAWNRFIALGHDSGEFPLV